MLIINHSAIVQGYPIHRFILSMYVEKHIEGKVTVAMEKAATEYLKQVTDNELELVFNTYKQQEELVDIEFNNGMDDCAAIWQHIYQTNLFKKLKNKYK